MTTIIVYFLHLPTLKKKNEREQKKVYRNLDLDSRYQIIGLIRFCFQKKILFIEGISKV